MVTLTAPAGAPVPLIESPAGVKHVGVLDVSGWQFAYTGSGRIRAGAQPPDFAKAAARGVVGVFGRVGNGSQRDQSFPLVWQAARDAGLAVGAYYYAQPNQQTAPVAAHWVVDTLAGAELDLPVMLDFEHYTGTALSPAATAAWLIDWLTIVEQLTGRTPIVYAGSAFANARTVAESLAEWDTIQPRYPRQGTTPPSQLDEWAGWITWHRDPAENGTLGDWEGWQFSADGNWSDFGAPADAATRTVDLNVVTLDAWNRWVTPAHQRTATGHALVRPPTEGTPAVDTLPPPVTAPPEFPKVIKLAAQPGAFAQWPGFKTWLPTPEARDFFLWAHGLALIEVPEQVFVAAGPVIGPRPDGYDEWGVRTR